LIHGGFQALYSPGLFQFMFVGLRLVPHAIFGNGEGIETAFAAVHPGLNRFQRRFVVWSDPITKVVFRLRVERGQVKWIREWLPMMVGDIMGKLLRHVDIALR